MGWRDDERALRRALVDATREVADQLGALRRILTPIPPERGYRARPRNSFEGLPGLALALRFCRDGDVSLAGLLRRVPPEYVDKGRVKCVCGAVVEVGESLGPCAGECGRWFIRSGDAVWSAMIDEPKPKVAP